MRTRLGEDSLAGFELSTYGRISDVHRGTNAVLLDEHVADEMAGVVDLVAITIDGSQDELLTRIGRNVGRHRGYFARVVEACARLTERGIAVKLHSVVGAMNHATLPDEVVAILDAIETRGGRVTQWKLYQYMSYDDPTRDRAHAIAPEVYAATRALVEKALCGRVPLHFKDNAEMNASMFNILSYGNAQYMRRGDTWSTSRRTRNLRSYSSMAEVFAAHDIDEVLFRRFHELAR